MYGYYMKNKHKCHYMALIGFLRGLQFERKNKCVWDSHTCTHAARGGHLEVIKWLKK